MPASIKRLECHRMELILLSFIIGIYYYPQMPEKMASHWNNTHKIDGKLFKIAGVITLLVVFFQSRESACNPADIIAAYKLSERFHIVGIEIKEWDKRVHPKMAMEYREAYRKTCEYFYRIFSNQGRIKGLSI